MISVRPQHIAPAACLLLLAGCSFGSTSSFTVSNASVDQGYSCPVSAKDVQYDLHGTINAHNGTAQRVNVTAVTAVMTLAAVNGGWLQKVGDKFDAGNVTYAPTSVDAGSSTSLSVTIPSACTGRADKSPPAWGDYLVTFTMKTSAGSFTLDSQNRHRITTA
jgi:hypothetical protein